MQSNAWLPVFEPGAGRQRLPGVQRAASLPGVQRRSALAHGTLLDSAGRQKVS